jgi:hypothetical protein
VNRRFQQIVLGWLLVLAVGGHWPLLQSVAWVKMLVSFSQTEGFTAAVAKTFDGKHPCNICSLVERGKQTEREQPARAPTVKIDFFLVASEPFVIQVPSVAQTDFVAPAWNPPLFPPAIPPPKFG